MELPGSGDAVCCMCGDHGLPGELFQCGLCRRRLQHRYCSEVYPRKAAYRSCNWCLREDEGRNPPAKAVPSTKRRRRDSGNKMSPSCGCSTRTAFKAEPGKPVKKFKNAKAPRRTTTEQRPVTTAAANGVQAGADRKARRFRGKVRRYKLLAEVIC